MTTLAPPRKVLTAADEARFERDVEPEPNSGCLIWTGEINHCGYGLFNLGGKKVSPHKVAYERKHGPVPGGLELDHGCRLRRCVNEAHLEAVTHAENMRRAMRTLCRKGHGATMEVIYGKRLCRVCWRANVKKSKAAYWARRRAARAA